MSSGVYELWLRAKMDSELAALIVGQEPVKRDALIHHSIEGLQRILNRVKIFFNIIFYTFGERVDSVSFEISVADSDGNSTFHEQREIKHSLYKWLSMYFFWLYALVTSFPLT